MKSFEVKALGLQEMKNEELAEVNGGWVVTVVCILLAVIPIAMDAYDHREDIVEGYQEGYDSVRNDNNE